MSTTTTRQATPAMLAAKVLAAELSNEELYGDMLEQVSADEFEQMENNIIATWRKDRPDDADERAMATQEVFFYLGLQIGKRIGGAR